MNITNCKRNIMGTVSFDGKCAGMRKPQDFIVYPMQDSGETITIQSEHRFGRIDLATGSCILSENKAQYANSITLALSIARGKAVHTLVPAEDLQTLRQWVKSTGGLLVGNSVVKSENIGAMAL
jgi:hypothetical protein